jgi:hypothetical protein
MKFPTDSVTGKYLDKAAALSWARTNGTSNKPQQPRNPQAQSGSRGALITWDMPVVFSDIVGFRIFKDSENSLLDTIYDPNVRQYKVQLSAGASPQVTNLFISSFNVRGMQSNPVQVQASSLAEASAPADPAAPANSASDPVSPAGTITNVGGGGRSVGRIALDQP